MRWQSIEFNSVFSIRLNTMTCFSQSWTWKPPQTQGRCTPPSTLQTTRGCTMGIQLPDINHFFVRKSVKQLGKQSQFLPAKNGALQKQSHLSGCRRLPPFLNKGWRVGISTPFEKKWLVFSTFCKYFVIGVLFDAEKKVAKSPLACQLGKEVGKKK